MRIRELEKLFQDEKTVDLALEDLVKDMEIVDKWMAHTLADFNDNTSEIDKAIDQLSRAHGNLIIVLGVAETEYRNRDVRYWNELKIKAEAEGEKFTDSKAKQEASLHVCEYRRIRNIVKAYKESANMRIVSLQSILKDINKDYGNPNK